MQRAGERAVGRVSFRVGPKRYGELINGDVLADQRDQRLQQREWLGLCARRLREGHSVLLGVKMTEAIYLDADFGRGHDETRAGRSLYEWLCPIVLWG